jgi:phosphinothricin tripeptide acetyl hydrolase
MAGDEIETIRAQLTAMRDVLPTELPELRAWYDGFSAAVPLPDGMIVETTEAGGVPALRLKGSNAVAGRTILYFHGGGYVIGSPASHRHLAAALAEAAAATVIALDYRLAPEHPFPAAVDDALAAYGWLLDHGQDPAKLVVAGDSAGGGLTVATLVAARDKGLKLAAAGVLISPWLDLAHTGPTLDTADAAGRDPLISRDGLTDMAVQYLAGRDAAATPLASPLYADLTGLPPLLIQVGGDEVLLDDSTRIDARARAQGVASTLEVWDEMVHVWHFFGMQLTAARDAIGKIGDFVRDKTKVA